MILDRQGQVLVANRPSFDLMVVLEDVGDIPLLGQRLGALLKLDVNQLRVQLDEARQAQFPVVRLQSDLTWNEMALVETYKAELPGVQVVVQPKREYRQKGFASHVLGYLGEITEAQLKSGRFSPQVQDGGLPGQGRGGIGMGGVPQRPAGLPPHRGGRLRPGTGGTGTAAPQPRGQRLPHPGHPAAAGGRGPASRERWGPSSPWSPKPARFWPWPRRRPSPRTPSTGDSPPRTGRSCQSPRTTPWRTGPSKDSIPRAPPSRSSWPSPAWRKRSSPPRPSSSAPGRCLGNHVFNCCKRGHGGVDLHRALVQSCDVYFYTVGHRLGIERIAKWSRLFGLGQPTGLKLDQEMPGLVASLAWKQRRFQRALAGRGHHLGGHRPGLQPHHALADGPGDRGHRQRRPGYRAPDGREGGEPGRGTLVSAPPGGAGPPGAYPAHLALVQKGLHGRGGAAAPAGTPSSPRWRWRARPALPRWCPWKRKKWAKKPFKNHAWFVAYAPVDDPKIAVAVISRAWRRRRGRGRALGQTPPGRGLS